jgi:inosine-uridine nucleoside N-ribohydrolase
VRRKIWIDTDLALGASRGDVDDGFALAAVALATRGGLVGVSAVTGNTDGSTAFAVIKDLLAVLAASVPAVAEARVVREPDAPAALLGLPEGTSIVAIGPPTNLMRAAALDPKWPGRVEVRVVGRVRWPRRHPLLRLFDLNFRAPAARAFWPLDFRRRIVFPLDVVRALRLDGDDLDRMDGAGPVGRYLAHHSRRWLRRAPVRYLSRSFPVWDLPAALHAVERLPGAVVNGGWLESFDVGGARRAFFALLEEKSEEGWVSDPAP